MTDTPGELRDGRHAEIVQPRLRRACTSMSSSHVSMRKRASFDGATGVRHKQLRGRPALLGGATRVGNFDKRQWGNSVSAVRVYWHNTHRLHSYLGDLPPAEFYVASRTDQPLFEIQ